MAVFIAYYDHNDKGGLMDEEAEALTGSIQVLADRIRELSETVAQNKERISQQDKIIAEQKDLQGKSRRNFFVASAAATVAVVIALVSFVNSKHIEKVSDDDADRTLGLLVGICAIQNVDRINQTNIIKRQQQAGFSGTDVAKTRIYYEDSLRDLQQVDCKALVPKKDQVNLKLEYPTTIPDAKP